MVYTFMAKHLRSFSEKYSYIQSGLNKGKQSKNFIDLLTRKIIFKGYEHKKIKLHCVSM